MAGDGVLRDVIRFFVDCASSKGVTRTPLVKLVFLADYEIFRARQHTLTGLEYTMDKMGPHSWDIPDTASDMLAEGVTQTTADSIFGGPEYRYRSAGKSQSGYPRIPSDCLGNLRAIWVRFGRYSAKGIVDVVHKMPFVRMFQIGESVDFRLALVSAKNETRLSRWKGLRPKGRVEHSPTEAAEFEYTVHRMKYGEEEAVPLS